MVVMTRRVIYGAVSCGLRVHACANGSTGNVVLGCSGVPIRNWRLWYHLDRRHGQPLGALDEALRNSDNACPRCRSGLLSGRLIWQEDTDAYWADRGLDADAAATARSLWRDWVGYHRQLAEAARLL